MQGKASSDHTTLLLNCYTRLKDVGKLDAFLKGSGSDDGTHLLNFDVETAVKVSRPTCMLMLMFVTCHANLCSTCAQGSDECATSWGLTEECYNKGVGSSLDYATFLYYLCRQSPSALL